jgi:hypothetical protein
MLQARKIAWTSYDGVPETLMCDTDTCCLDENVEYLPLTMQVIFLIEYITLNTNSLTSLLGTPFIHK